MINAILTLTLILTTPQEWEYVYDGEIYTVTSSIQDLDDQYFITLDGETIYIKDLTN